MNVFAVSEAIVHLQIQYWMEVTRQPIPSS
jgi:hypothetical protein